MFKIAHRGNLSYSCKQEENNPTLVDAALNKSYHAEIDLWLMSGENLFLGHDSALYPITLNWLLTRKEKLWIHCKERQALIFLAKSRYRFNYFWHSNDEYTLTSFGYIWAFPSKAIIPSTVNVLPEKFDSNWHLLDWSTAFGVCSDEIDKLKK
jgi:hypothetical protein